MAHHQLIDANETIMNLNNKRIFIVEDNVHNRVIYQIMLKRYNVRLEFDRWGRETLRHMRDFGDIDLIILDLMLPSGISGFDIFDDIRADGSFAHVPIVAVSAADPSMAIAKTKAKGFAGFIAKPVDDDLFPEQMSKIIDGEQLWIAGDRYQGIE